MNPKQEFRCVPNNENINHTKKFALFLLMIRIIGFYHFFNPLISSQSPRNLLQAQMNPNNPLSNTKRLSNPIQGPKEIQTKVPIWPKFPRWRPPTLTSPKLVANNFIQDKNSVLLFFWDKHSGHHFSIWWSPFFLQILDNLLQLDMGSSMEF